MALFDCACEATSGHARALSYETAHGTFHTPMFMPVGTSATVKGVTAGQLRDLNSQVVLANTYHLSLRPGADVVAEAGGVHRFMNYDGPMLTDSGGFQVFSLADTLKLDDDGLTFRSIYDGSKIRWTPESNMAIQEQLGADIAMQLDQCTPYPAERAFVAKAVDLSANWARRCLAAHVRPDQTLFGIVQGGMELDLRLESIRRLREIEDESLARGARRFGGFGIGGYSVGEDHEVMFETLGPVARACPEDRPRYLMGVGNPTTLVRAVREGVDMFDCVLPTRTARMGTAFSSHGPHEHAQREVHARLRPARRRLHVPDVPKSQSRLHPPPREAERDARRHPPVHPQPALPHRPHAPRPRGGAGRCLRGVLRGVDGQPGGEGLLGRALELLFFGNRRIFPDKYSLTAGECSRRSICGTIGQLTWRSRSARL